MTCVGGSRRVTSAGEQSHPTDQAPPGGGQRPSASSLRAWRLPSSPLCSSQSPGAPPSEPAPLSLGLLAAGSNRSGLRSQA